MKAYVFAALALAVLSAAPLSQAASGTAADFHGEWGCREEAGGIYVQYTYFFYENGTGKFVHEGNAGGDWSVSELFSWSVQANGTVRFGFSYGTSFYAYSFNADHDELTFTYEGGTQRTYAKEGGEPGSAFQFCGFIPVVVAGAGAAAAIACSRAPRE